jgi:class 3 adenylate cyclase
MFTDIKGFSAMMGKDEERTMRLVREHREIVRATLPDHSGHEHETIGDAFVVLFDSAVNAVQCAAEIQTRFRARNAELPEEEQVWIRVGIHVGDIILKDGDIYGDGVNIAARVEPQAEPGGICITQDVFMQVQKKVGLRAISIGRKELKNIKAAPELYRILLEGDEVPYGEALADALGRPEWPKAPIWKKILWFALTLPLCWMLMLFVTDFPIMVLAPFGLPVDSPSWLAILIGCLLCLALSVGAFMVYRFWSAGKWNRWIQGFGFAVFPAAIMLFVLYHYFVLQGHADSHLATVQSYGVIGNKIATDMTAKLIAAYEHFLNANGLLPTFVGMFALIIAMGYAFVRPRGARRKGGWKRWFVLLGGVVVFFAAVFVAFPTLQAAGGWTWTSYLAWVVSAVAIIKLRDNPLGEQEFSWRALHAGLVATVSFFGGSVSMGYASMVQHVKGIPQTEAKAWGIMLVLFLTLMLVFRRSFPLSRRAGNAKRALLGVGIVALMVLPLPVLYSVMIQSGHQMWIYDKFKLMYPGELSKEDGPSFYIDREPQSLTLAAGGLFTFLVHGGPEPRDWRVAEQQRTEYTEEKLKDLLAGNKQCPEIIDAALAKDGKDESVRCITAIEARLYCERMGLRLPTPEEWEAEISKVPLEADEDSDSPFTRGPFAEWTMTVVHGTPTFQVSGAEGVEGAPDKLDPNEFSDKVGFRCAFSFEE